MKRLLSAVTLFSLFWLSSCAVITEPGRDIRTADNLLTEKKFNDAATAYRKVLRDHPDSHWAADARYGLAVVLVSSDNPQKDYSLALQEFEEFLRLYPNDDRAADARNWRLVLRTLIQVNKKIEDLQKLDVRHEEKRKRK